MIVLVLVTMEKVLVVLLSNLLPVAEVVTLGMFNKEMRCLSILLVLIFSLFLLSILPAPFAKLMAEKNYGTRHWILKTLCRKTK